MTRRGRWSWAIAALLCILAIGWWWAERGAPDSSPHEGPERRAKASRPDFPDVADLVDERGAPANGIAAAAVPAGDDVPTGMARNELRRLRGTAAARQLHEEPGCDEATTSESRAALLRSFHEHGAVAAGDGYEGSLEASPELEPAVVSDTLSLLLARAIPRRVDSTLGTRSPPADIVLYRDVSELRRYDCVRSDAVAFYDGTIHLARSAMISWSWSGNATRESR